MLMEKQPELSIKDLEQFKKLGIKIDPHELIQLNKQLNDILKKLKNDELKSALSKFAIEYYKVYDKHKELINNYTVLEKYKSYYEELQNLINKIQTCENYSDLVKSYKELEKLAPYLEECKQTISKFAELTKNSEAQEYLEKISSIAKDLVEELTRRGIEKIEDIGIRDIIKEYEDEIEKYKDEIEKLRPRLENILSDMGNQILEKLKSELQPLIEKNMHEVYSLLKIDKQIEKSIAEIYSNFNQIKQLTEIHQNFFDTLRNIEVKFQDNTLYVKIPQGSFKFSYYDKTFSIVSDFFYLKVDTSYFENEINKAISSGQYHTVKDIFRNVKLEDINFQLSLNVDKISELFEKYNINPTIGDIPSSEIFKVLKKNKIPEIHFNSEIYKRLNSNKLLPRISAFNSMLNRNVFTLPKLEESINPILQSIFSCPQLMNPNVDEEFSSEIYGGYTNIQFDQKAVSAPAPVEGFEIYVRTFDGRIAMYPLIGVGVESGIGGGELGVKIPIIKKIGPLTVKQTIRVGLCGIEGVLIFYVGEYAKELQKFRTYIPTMEYYLQISKGPFTFGTSVFPQVSLKEKEGNIEVVPTFGFSPYVKLEIPF